MFQYFKYLFNYLKISYNLVQIYSNKQIIKDDIFVDNFLNIISNNGCMLIKCIQWVLPRYIMIYGENNITKKMEKFYDNCPIHSMSYSEEVYNKNFNKNLYDEYVVNDIIGSGSIGQVYLITSKKNKKRYAMKIIHPNVYYEFRIFRIFFYIFYYIILYKYNILKDIKVLVKDIELQLNYNNEAFNCKKIYELYKNNKYIKVPEVYKYKKDILLMEYIDMSDNINKLDNDDFSGIVKKYKCLLLLIVFINNNCLNNISHGDMHPGNWSIHYDKHPRVNIIDFGFCFNISLSDFKTIDKYINKPTCLNTIKYVFEYILKDECNETIDILSNELHKKTYNYKILEEHIKELFLLLIKYNIKVNSSTLNALFLYYQLSANYEFLDDNNRNNNYYESNFGLELQNICDYYDICNNYKEYLTKEIINNTNFKTSNKLFEKYRNLCIS